MKLRNKFTLLIIKKYKKFKRNFQRFTGYTWDSLLNAITISTFILLVSKIFFSLFFYKFTFFQHFFSLIFLIIFSLYFNFYRYVNSLLIFILENTLSPSFFEPFDPDNEIEQEKDLKHIIMEYLLTLFIRFRLCFLCEPLLFSFFKFCILYWFLYDYNLTLAYLFSFLFIFSRLLFFLTDDNYQEMIRPLKKFNCVTLDAISPENTNVIIFWILRILNTKTMHNELRQEKKLFLFDYHYMNYFSSKITQTLQRPKLKMQKKHFYTKIFLIAVSISFFLSWQNDLLYLGKLDALIVEKIKEFSKKNLNIGHAPKKEYSHENVTRNAICKGNEKHKLAINYQQLSTNEVATTQYAFTSIKTKPEHLAKSFYSFNFELYPLTYYKKSNGTLCVQGASGIGLRNILTHAEFLELYKLEKSKEHKKTPEITDAQLQQMELHKEKIILDMSIFDHTTTPENRFYFVLDSFLHPTPNFIPAEILSSFWALLQGNYTPAQRYLLFEQGLAYLKLFPNDQQLAELLILGLDCTKNYSNFIPNEEFLQTDEMFLAQYKKTEKYIADTKARLKDISADACIDEIECEE